MFRRRSKESIMNELMTPTQPLGYKDSTDNDMFDGDDSNVTRQRHASFVSRCESVQTGTTLSLSERSWAKSSAYGEASPIRSNEATDAAWLQNNPLFAKALSQPTMPKQLEDNPVSRQGEAANKAGRRVLVGMIAKVMNSTRRDSKNETGEEATSTEFDAEDVSLLVDEGIRISLQDCSTQLEDTPSSNPAPSTQQKAQHDDSYHEVSATRIVDRPATFDQPPSRPRGVLGRSASTSAANAPAYSYSVPLKRSTSNETSLVREDLEQESGPGDRDTSPRMPPRRRSFESFTSRSSGETQPSDDGFAPPPDLSVGSPRPAKRTTIRANMNVASASDFQPMSKEELQKYVMSRIPKFVQEQLPSEEWNRVFSVAAESQKSQSTGSRSAESIVDRIPAPAKVVVAKVAVTRPVVVDDTSTVVSGLTNPASFAGSGVDDSSPRVHKTKVSQVDVEASSSLPSRSWHEGSTRESAPKVPRRFDLGTSQRRMSAPIKQSQKTPVLRRSNTTDAGSKNLRSVSFDKAHVRYYERILDVNPSTSSGPSVGLGWKYKEMKAIDLDCVQDIPTDARRLVIPRHVRENIVRELGYTRTDIAKAVRQSLKLKNQRTQTYHNLRHEKVEYLVEKSKRKVGQLLRFGAARRTSLQSHDKWSA